MYVLVGLAKAQTMSLFYNGRTLTYALDYLQLRNRRKIEDSQYF